MAYGRQVFRVDVPDARALAPSSYRAMSLMSIAVSIDISPTFSRVPKISYMINLLN